MCIDGTVRLWKKTVQYIVSISHVLHWWHSPTLKKKKSYDFNNYRNKIEYIPEGLPRRKNMFRSMNSYASSLHLRVLAWPIRIPDSISNEFLTLLSIVGSPFFVYCEGLHISILPGFAVSSQFFWLQRVSLVDGWWLRWHCFFFLGWFEFELAL